ncbi:MAG: beta-propeller fold lactonase family protein [Bacilli bacterium]|nr:beta-propeller fold lactonase family protein [Bacilli bacterium]
MKVVVSGYHDTMKLLELTPKGVQVLDCYPIINASFIITDGTYYYTYEQEPTLKFVSFTLLKNHFVKVDEIPVPGKGLTHLTLSNKHEILVGASYHDGMVHEVQIREGHFVSPITTIQDHNNLGLSRPHWVGFTPQEDELLIVNIAQDRIGICDWALKPIRDIHLEKGVGPRHALFNHDGTILYVISEYSNELISIHYQTGTVIEKHSTLLNPKVTSYGATLAITQDEKMLYASNRGDETIACFKIHGSSCTLVSHIPTYGKHSRHMILSRDESLIVSANKDSSEIVFIDTHTHHKIGTHSYPNPTGLVEVHE